jgi:hypothetical protein
MKYKVLLHRIFISLLLLNQILQIFCNVSQEKNNESDGLAEILKKPVESVCYVSFVLASSG